VVTFGIDITRQSSVYTPCSIEVSFEFKGRDQSVRASRPQVVVFQVPDDSENDGYSSDESSIENALEALRNLPTMRGPVLPPRPHSVVDLTGDHVSTPVTPANPTTASLLPSTAATIPVIDLTDQASRPASQPSPSPAQIWDDEDAPGEEDEMEMNQFDDNRSISDASDMDCRGQGPSESRTTMPFPELNLRNDEDEIRLSEDSLAGDASVVSERDGESDENSHSEGDSDSSENWDYSVADDDEDDDEHEGTCFAPATLWRC
jgi:hypothetical protein